MSARRLIMEQLSPEQLAQLNKETEISYNEAPPAPCCPRNNNKKNHDNLKDEPDKKDKSDEKNRGCEIVPTTKWVLWSTAVLLTCGLLRYCWTYSKTEQAANK